MNAVSQKTFILILMLSFAFQTLAQEKSTKAGSGFTSAQLAERALQRRAVEAVIYGPGKPLFEKTWILTARH